MKFNNSFDFREMSAINPLDSIRLNFPRSDLLLLNLALALIMYGVALDLMWSNFRYLSKNSKGFFWEFFLSSCYCLS